MWTTRRVSTAVWRRHPRNRRAPGVDRGEVGPDFTWWTHPPRRRQADTGPRRPGARRARRRAAVRPGRLRGRRAPRHRAAGRSRPRLDHPDHRRRPVRLPRLRHHGSRLTTPRHRRPRRRAAARRRRHVARARPRRAARRRPLARRRAARRRARGGRRGRASRPSPTCAGRRPACPGCSSSSPPRARCAGCRTPARRSSSRRSAPSSTPSSTSCSSTALDLGIAGSGLGTALTQLAMGVVLSGRRRAWRARSRCAPAPARRRHRRERSRRRPLLVRTLSLRSAILLTVWVATGLGPGRARRAPGGQRRLGPRRVRARRARHRRPGARRPRARARATCRGPARCCAGRCSGVSARVRCSGSCSAAPRGRTSGCSRPTTRPGTPPSRALVVAAVTMPMAGWVFVLDGVLIGAGDGRFLAWAGVAHARRHAPRALLVQYVSVGVARDAWLWAALRRVLELS